MVDVTVAAQDLPSGRKKGEISGLTETPNGWGAKEVLPNFIRLRITDRTVAQAQSFVERRTTKFLVTFLGENVTDFEDWRIEVDPAVISASGIGRDVKLEMKQTVLEVTNGEQLSQTSSSLTFRAAKGVVVANDLKAQMEDLFGDVIVDRELYLSNGAVNQIVGAGGYWEGTWAEASPYIKRRIDE